MEIKFVPGKTLEDVKEEYILSALRHHDWSVYFTCIALNVSHSMVSKVERKFRHLKYAKPDVGPKIDQGLPIGNQNLKN